MTSQPPVPTQASWSRFWPLFVAALAALGITVGVVNSGGTPTPTPSPSVSVTVTPTPTPSPSSTPSTATATPTATPTPTPSPSVTVTPPPLRSFPDATTTGWRHTGVTLAPSGPITVTVDGTVIDSKDITGGVVIKANNVTVSRSRITGGAYFGIRVYAGFTGATITDTEIVGVNDPTGGLPRCDAGINGGNLIQRVDVSGCADLLHPSANSVVSDNYLHGPYHSATSHNDGIQLFAGAGYLIHHNTILMGHTENSAVFVKADFGNLSNIVIDGNYVDGGVYTIFGGDAAPHTVTNVSVTNNLFGLSRVYGQIFTSRMTGPVTVAGNVDTNGAAVP